MKLVIAYIQPHKLPDVKQERLAPVDLHRLGFQQNHPARGETLLRHALAHLANGTGQLGHHDRSADVGPVKTRKLLGGRKTHRRLDRQVSAGNTVPFRKDDARKQQEP